MRCLVSGVEDYTPGRGCAGLPGGNGVEGLYRPGKYRGNDVAINCNFQSKVGERIFSLDQAELAFRSLAAGGHKGKLVVRMEDPVRAATELALLR